MSNAIHSYGLSEAELVTGLKNGDEAAYRTLVRRYQDRLFKVAFGILLDREEAWDIVQDVFFKVFQSIHSFKSQARLATWLHRITVNHCLNWKRRWKRRLRQFHRPLDTDANDPLGHYPPIGTEQNQPERQIREVEDRFRARLNRPRRKRKKIQNLRTGEWVRVLDLNREGTVSQVQETADTAEVLVGQFKIKTSLDNLERVPGKTEASDGAASSTAVVSSSDEARHEINVIGLTVDEALPMVDKFIDTALLANLETVTVIHGSGSGRLRDGIQSYLKVHKAVTGFEHGDPLRGGLGVTVVRLGWDRKAAMNEQPEDHPRVG